VVDLFTKRGWDFDDAGGSGPGEFGGKIPSVAVADTIVWTVSQQGQLASRDLRSGLLLDAEGYRYPVYCCGAAVIPVGVLENGDFVTAFTDLPQGTRDSVLARGVRVHGRDGKLLWSHEGIPPVTLESDQGATFAGMVAAARHSRVAVGASSGSRVTVFDSDGVRRGLIENGTNIWSMFIDAGDRIWVQSMLGDENGDPRSVYRVYDRGLQEVFTVYLPSLLDALDQQIVAQSFDEFDALQLHLITFQPPS
jgi:hypothetical protein